MYYRGILDEANVTFKRTDKHFGPFYPGMTVFFDASEMVTDAK